MKFLPSVALALLVTARLNAPARAGVIINELMYHPKSELDAEEFIELHNPDATVADLSGWRFTTGVRFTFPAGTKLAAGGYLVVAANEVAFTNKYPDVTNYVAGWDGILSNSGQKVELVDQDGLTVNSVNYADDGDWAPRLRDIVDHGHRGWNWQSPADDGGYSLELVQPALSNHAGQNWTASSVLEGTPGRANSVVSADVAPLIVDAGHFPLVPKSSQSIALFARVLDEAVGATLSLHHRVDGTPAFTSAPMFDDGLHEDGAAADGVFGAVLPPHANNSIIEFYFESQDAAGRKRTWPAPALVDGVSEQVVNALLQVDDQAPPLPVTPGALPVYRLVLTAAERAELTQINKNAPAAPIATSDQTLSHSQFNATFIGLDGTGSQVRYNVGVRNRGNGSRTKSPQSFRVNFLNDDPWKEVTAINLNTQSTASQLFGSALYRRCGLPTQEARPVLVRVNNVDSSTPAPPTYGFHVANEVVNSEFAGRSFPLDSSGNFYRGIRLTGRGADLSYLGADPDFYRTNYFKQSNTSQDQWGDLIALTQTLDNEPEATYRSAVEARVDVAEWMLYFAIETLVDNKETNLANGNNGTGQGDDYFLYFGVDDPRSKLVPYDLDTILGQGDLAGNPDDGLFRMNANPIVARFMMRPEFAPVYYDHLLRLANSVFTPAQLDPLVEEILFARVDESVRSSIKDFAEARRLGVLAQIPQQLSATNGEAASANGVYTSAVPSFSLHGRAHAVTTRAVLINGVAATWSAWEARWTNHAIALHPGLNRVLIQSLDGQGTETERTYVEAAYDDGSVVSAGGTLAQAATWTAANGPYRVTSPLTVPAGVTLTIEPGTTVQLAAGARLTVAEGGTLKAFGSDTARIRFTKVPGAANWSGLVIQGTADIAYADFDSNSTTAIHVNGGTVTFDHLDFHNRAQRYLALDGSSFVVSHCTFPTPTAAFELLHGTGGIKAGGHGILRDCFLGLPQGYNDVFDFTGGNRPGQPLLQVYHNVFIGGSDDLLDLDGTDAWVEGNIFLHCHKNGTPDSSSAVSGGSDSGNTSQVTVINNLFFDCDQAVTAKQGNFYTVLDNTIVHISHLGGLDSTAAVFNLADEGTTSGAGLYLEGNVITDIESLARDYEPTRSTVTLNRNALPQEWAGPGAGNLVAAPRFQHLPEISETQFTNFESAQMLRSWLQQTPTSPAAAIRGGGRPQGMVLTGEPIGTTHHTSANVLLGPVSTDPSLPAAWGGGAGYTRFQWRLDGGAWSPLLPTTSPIVLNGLADGPHVVEARGENDVGLLQDSPLLGDDARISSSRTWTVDHLRARLVLNEVLARNNSIPTGGNSFPDLVELFNDSAQTRELAGVGLGTDPLGPPQFVFPAGTMLPADSHVVLFGGQGAGLHLGFSLKAAGDSLALFDPQGHVIDQVTFGPQLADLSIGRLPDDSWGLCQPTFGEANRAASTGDPALLRINEWLAASEVQFKDDFIELYNPDTLPVPLGGLFLTDNPIGYPRRHEIAPLSFIAPNGFALFLADGQTAKGPEHLDFSLAAENGTLGLTGPEGAFIDSVVYPSQYVDVSQGRSPSGAALIEFFSAPTPGGGNPGFVGDGGSNVTTENLDLIDITHDWRYSQSGDLGTQWRAPGFNDDAWSHGKALFYVETASLPAPKNTVLTIGKMTYYFRTHFDFTTNTAGFKLKLKTVLDDGCVVWLNGKELARVGMPSGTISYGTDANRTVGNAVYEGPLTLSATDLKEGDNVLAVEVHQSGSDSTDVVWGMALAASRSITNHTATSTPVVLNEVLAHNYSLVEPDGSWPDWIELYNPNTNAVDLADHSLTDDLTLPRRFVFPSGSVLPAKGWLRVLCDPLRPASTTNTGFGLRSNGETIYLLDPLARGGGVTESVALGLQVSDLSVGRVPDGTGPWKLTSPSPAAANQAVALGTSTALRVNEWMANPAAGEDDWFELHNPGAQPVDLSGFHLTDDLTVRDRHTLPALSFIGTGRHGYVVFNASGNAGQGADHVNFSLSKAGESIGLFSPDEFLVDGVSFGAQALGASEGRFPDDAVTFVTFPALSTPGGQNLADVDVDGIDDEWEPQHGLSANDPTDAGLDPDHDGASNRIEFLTGTDPGSPGSVLRVSMLFPGDTGPVLSFTAELDRAYRVEYSDAIVGAPWTSLLEVPAHPVKRTIEVADPEPPGGMTRYFRVVLVNRP